MKPYLLIPDRISHETVEALEQLLERARTGSIVGIGFVALMKGRRYIVNSAGECRTDPTLTRGMVLALDDELKQLLHSRGFDETNL